jgi:hypothetical protein
MGKKLMALVVLVGVVGALVPAAGAQIITKVERRNPDANSGAAQVVVAPGPLAENATCYADRTHIFQNVPEALLGAEYVLMSNDDKDNPNHELHVTIAKAAILYVLLDNRIGTNTGGAATTPNPTAAGMTWFTQMGFVDTGWNIAVDESADGDIDNYFSVFSMPVTPGVIILKAQNDTFTGGPGSRNMYGVAAALPLMKASKPSPADGEPGLTLPLFQWTPGATGVLHNVYLGASPELTEADRVGSSLIVTTYYHTAPLTPGVTYFWRVDEVEADLQTVHTGDVWSFTVASLSAFQPVPADGVGWVEPDADLSWKPGQGALTHDLYLDTDKAAVEERRAAVSQKGFYPATWKPANLALDTVYYWCVDETDATGTRTAGPVWSFRTMPPAVTTDPNLIGWWRLDEDAGTRAFDLSGHANHGTVQGAQRIEGIHGGALRFAGAGQVDLPAGLIQSKLGSMAFWVQTAQTTIGTIFYGTATSGNGYGGENELHVNVDTGQARLYIEGSPDVSVWSGIAINNNEWQHVAATWDAVSVQLYVNGNQVGQAGNTGNDFTASGVVRLGRPTSAERFYDGGLDDVRLYDRRLPADEIKQMMRGDPLLAWDPQPARNATVDIRAATTLRWSAGDAAVQHDVYLGQDPAAVANADPNSPAYQGRQAGTDFSLAGRVEFGGGGYSWRIDEVNGDGSITRGFVWTFTVPDYLIVEEFESYDDAEDAGTRIYENWIDGYVDGSSGSTVGNLDPPFAERTVVHGGRQSMPMDYDNSNSPFYSEAYREFAPLQNWQAEGVTDLSLWFRGWPAPPTVNETAPGQFSVTGAGTDIWNNGDQFTFVYKTLNGDGTLIAHVIDKGTGSNTWAKGGVMIRDSLDAGSVHAMMILSANSDGAAGNGASFQYRLTADGASDSSSAATVITAPYWVKIERQGDTLTGWLSPDGTNWTQQGTAQFIAMTAPAYVGLCVSSHAANEYRTFQFDNVKATGATGAWQAAEVGFIRNSPQGLYLVVEDSNGKSFSVAHPDASATVVTTWTEWKIPLSSLTGVNLAKVKRLYIGVGDEKNPAADGTGRIYIDDIHLVKSAPAQ